MVLCRRLQASACTCVYRSASSSQASLSVWYRSTYLRSNSMAACRLPCVFSLPTCAGAAALSSRPCAAAAAPRDGGALPGA